jgi:hypothetical protein
MSKQYAGNPKYDVNEIQVGMIVRGKYGVHPKQGIVIKIGFNPHYDEKIFQLECEDEQGKSYSWLRLYEIEEIISSG